MKRVGPGVALLLIIVSVAACRASGQGGATVGGVVRDLHGTPQMGALIELLAPDASVIAHTFTDDQGRYVLPSVAPGRYALRGSAAFLTPVLRSNLRLNSGARAVANLTMTALFEVGVWFPAEKRRPDEPSDDWRWTLRSTANRPLLRLDGTVGTEDTSSSADHARATVSQGRLALLTGDGTFADGGTRQVLSLDRSEGGGRAEILTADLGDASLPGAAGSMAISAGYERQLPLGAVTRMVAAIQSSPEIAGPAGSGLQVMTVASTERMSFGDAVMIDAGTLLSAERLVSSRVSSAPFFRVVTTPIPGVALMYRFASARTVQSSDDLDDLTTRQDVLTDAAGRPVDMKGLHQELAASRTSGKDTETIALYQDALPVTGLQGDGMMGAKELAGLPILADPSTGTFRVALKGYVARGISVSWTHEWNAAVMACVEADLGSAMVRSGPLALANLAPDVRARSAGAIGGTVHGTVSRTGTTYRVQYRWQPRSTLDQVNAYNTAPEQAYLSFFLRQKLWSGRRLQGMDAVLEARNLLEEGYQPVVGPDGETLFLAQVPRAIQAGLSFSF